MDPALVGLLSRDPSQLVAFLQETLAEMEGAAGGCVDVEARMKLQELQNALAPKPAAPPTASTSMSPELLVAAQLESLEKQLDSFQQSFASADPEVRTLVAHAQAQAIDPAALEATGEAMQQINETDEADASSCAAGAVTSNLGAHANGTAVDSHVGISLQRMALAVAAADDNRDGSSGGDGAGA